jgi:hypothetical protein
MGFPVTGMPILKAPHPPARFPETQLDLPPGLFGNGLAHGEPTHYVLPPGVSCEWVFS